MRLLVTGGSGSALWVLPALAAVAAAYVATVRKLFGARVAELRPKLSRAHQAIEARKAA